MDNMFLWFLAMVVVAIIATIAQVEFAYDGDYRCIVAECRIVKE